MRFLTRIARFAAVVAVMAPVAAFAGEWRDYEPAAFAEAQQAGETIFVAVHADWCSSCRAQRPILDALVDDPMFEDATAFLVDFDTQRDFLAEHQVRYQTTPAARWATATGSESAPSSKRLSSPGATYSAACEAVASAQVSRSHRAQATELSKIE